MAGGNPQPAAPELQNVTQRSQRFVFIVILGCLLFARDSARSHEFALESVINGFVKVEPRELHLIVRVPLHVITSVRFPLRGREIDLANAEPAIQRALALLKRDLSVWEDGRSLDPVSGIGRLSLPSDPSFQRYQEAVRHIAERAGQGAEASPGQSIYSEQGYFDAHLTYATTSPDASFAIETRIAPELKDYLKFALRYIPIGEKSRAMVITSRSGRVVLNPGWYQAAASFVTMGVEHILSGIDHLLFLLCLVIPFRRMREVVPIVTAFTVAHSFTLIGSAYNLAPSGPWFPPFVETAIAASIVFMALENIVGADLRRRWLITGLFGLVHGFGFSYGLQQNLQFAGKHLLVSLFSFNVGIELGQIAVLAVMLPALALLFRVVRIERLGVIVLSALVAHTGWHWMIERGEVLWKVPWPRLDAAALVTLARWLIGALLAAFVFRLLAKRAGALFSRRAERRRAS